MLLRTFFFPKDRSGGAGARAERDFFWRHGISGENRTAVVIFSGKEEEENELYRFIRLFKYMCVCGERFDLIVLYEESDAYRGAVRQKIEHIVGREGCAGFLSRDGGIHLLAEGAFSENEKTLLPSLCEAFIRLCALPQTGGTEGFFEISQKAEDGLLKKAVLQISGEYKPPEVTVGNTSCGDFTPFGFRVRKGHGGAPFATVAFGRKFGFVATENSLGFSFYENAALGKLTPHKADNMREDNGERLFLRLCQGEEHTDFDLCACAAFAEFGENMAYYGGKIAETEFRIEVSVDEKMPLKKICVSFSPCAPEGAAVLLTAEPCLGEQSGKAGRYIYERGENAVFVSSAFENPISLALACAEKADFIGDEAELISGGHICGGKRVSALCTEASLKSEVCFYLGAVNAEFTRDAFLSFIKENSFKKSAVPPIFGAVNIKTENSVFDLSGNRLFPYQTYYSRFAGRTGFYQVGGAYGFRDQLQDGLSFLENAPELCRAQVLLAAAHVYSEGDAAHWWHSFAGKETCLRSRYADDLLWLPYVLCEYVEKTGDESVLFEKVPYLCSPPLDVRENERYEAPESGGEGTVLEHACLCAITVWERGFGAHGLLKFGGGDWNDGMNLVGAKGYGESVWLTEFSAIVYHRLAKLLERMGKEADARFWREAAERLYESFSAAFYGNWFLRGYYDSGAPLGKKGNEECEIDAISQSFAVFAEIELFGKVSEQAHTAVLSAYDRLFDSSVGIMKLLSPPFDNGAEQPGYIKGYLPGVRENGGQYTHAAVWTAMALLLSGEKEKGFRVLKAINPAVRSEDAEFCRRYRIEPYVLAGDVYSHPDHAGRGGWSHYTGAAAWYRKAVLETVFGLKLCGEGFRLLPNMPRELDGAELLLDICSTRYRIRYFFGKEGVLLDGAETEKNVFAFDGGEHTLELGMAEQ
jgi:cyclic beta-1,2-glucan synthetase